MTKNVDGLQKEYQTELLEFLIEKINHAGGSLQFQHLSGLLQQLRFEVRDAFGVTKSVLMKFLKANSNIFNVDSKGIVTVVNSTLNISDSLVAEENKGTEAGKTFASKIENGKGRIYKIFSQYAIIKTSNPIKTYIFFTPLEFGAEKDSLFLDFDLNIGDKVGFNAIHGHIDYEIKYRATKVWKIYDSDDGNENPCNENVQRNKITKTNKVTGEGIIKKLFPDVGYIAGLGKENINVLFYRTNFKDLNLKLEDLVEFVAEYHSKELQATEIIKKKKISKPSNCSQTCMNKSSSPSQTSFKETDKHISDENLQNEPGKICPHSKGAIIKFGKNFSELADGSNCDYYLLGIKVAYEDIAMEFSENDDVLFDAVKQKDAPGWKAVLVWVGEKPSVIPKTDKKFKNNFDNTKTKNKVDHDELASDLSSNISGSNERRKINNNKDKNTLIIGERKMKAQFDRISSKNINSLSENYHNDNIIASKTVLQKLPHKNSKNRRNKNNKNYNKNSNDKHNQNKSFSNFKGDNTARNNEDFTISRDLDLYISDSSAEEKNELEDSSYFPKKFLKEDKQYLTGASDLKDETCSESEEMFKNEESFTKEKSGIKVFEDIDGVITKLHCKVAFIQSNQLKKDVDFTLNAFYLNGKSVEEQQVDDLKEVIKLGDIIKFNCFEIIDDSGEIHQKVTMAWKGSKPPNVYEITPEEFISAEELHVSSAELDIINKPGENFDVPNCIAYDEVSELNSEEFSIKDKFDDASQRYPLLKSRSDDVDKHASASSDDDNLQEGLPNKVLRKIETFGFLHSNAKDALNAAQEIIDLVLSNSNIKDVSVNPNYLFKDNSASLCASCGKTNITKDAEVQTLVTGEVVATNIFTDDF